LASSCPISICGVADRRTRLILIAFGVFVFLGISLLLARALVGAGAERSKVLAVLRAQARGDAAGVLAQLPDCRSSAACTRVVRERTPKLKRPGDVQILNFMPSVELTFTDRSGPARVAWRTDERSFPVVQCVVVRRQGPLSGGGVQLVSISNPVGLEASCRN
jgi:hypothetical protein